MHCDVSFFPSLSGFERRKFVIMEVSPEVLHNDVPVDRRERKDGKTKWGMGAAIVISKPAFVLLWFTSLSFSSPSKLLEFFLSTATYLPSLHQHDHVFSYFCAVLVSNQLLLFFGLHLLFSPP